MSHEIEQAWIAGGAAGWWDYQKQYHQAELMTPQEAWEKGPIRWGVDLVPVEYNDEETDYSLVVRDSDDKVLNCVGPQFTPLQNEKLMDMMVSLCDAGQDLGIDSVMSLKGGKVVVICARRPEAVLIAGEATLQHIVAANWHGGVARSALFYASNVRAECANTLRFGIDTAKNVYRFRHVGNIDDRIAEAREVLELSYTYHDRVVEIGNEMARQRMSKKQFEDFLKKAVPVKSDDEQSTITKVMNTRDGLREIYRDTPDLQNLPESPWRALQAVAAYSDHAINYKSDDNRFVAALTQDNMNQRAYDILAKQYSIA